MYSTDSDKLGIEKRKNESDNRSSPMFDENARSLRESKVVSATDWQCCSWQLCDCLNAARWLQANRASVVFEMSLFSRLHSPLIQHNNTVSSFKSCLKNVDENWLSVRRKKCEAKVSEFKRCLRGTFETSAKGGRVHLRGKYEVKDYRDGCDRVPPCPRIKSLKLLKVAVVVSTGIYVGDVIGKSFQDTILSLRDELWYPYED
jgi:hypothetical protein